MSPAMRDFDQTFPALLSELHELDIDFDEDNIDFEPYQEFRCAEDNAEWIQAWTRNDALSASEYRIFGQDGTGGYAAIWLVRKDKPLLEQPIVFFGSEGNVGVVATDFYDYLWLLAGGFGPCEAVENKRHKAKPNAEFTKFAERHAKSRKKKPLDVIAAAEAEFPKFEASIRALCK
jgi:hypothetical protein